MSEVYANSPLYLADTVWIWTIYPWCTFPSVISRISNTAGRVPLVGTNCSVSLSLATRIEKARNILEFLILQFFLFLIKLHVSASFGGIFGLCLGGSVMSVIELVYLLVWELFKLRKTQRQSRKSLPPAAEVFLSIPAEKTQLQKSRNHREPVDNRVYVPWYQQSVQRRNAMNSGDPYNKRIKF